MSEQIHDCDGSIGDCPNRQIIYDILRHISVDVRLRELNDTVLKPCSICGQPAERMLDEQENIIRCTDAGVCHNALYGVYFNEWQSRPIEDALRHEINKVSADNQALRWRIEALEEENNGLRAGDGESQISGANCRLGKHREGVPGMSEQIDDTDIENWIRHYSAVRARDLTGQDFFVMKCLSTIETLRSEIAGLTAKQVEWFAERSVLNNTISAMEEHDPALLAAREYAEGLERRIAELEAELITAHLDTQNAMEDAAEQERKLIELQHEHRPIHVDERLPDHTCWVIVQDSVNGVYPAYCSDGLWWHSWDEEKRGIDLYGICLWRELPKPVNIPLPAAPEAE